MTTRRLLDTERYTIINALNAAADTYATDAYTCDQTGQPRLAQTFRRQRDEARALADALENSKAIVVHE